MSEDHQDSNLVEEDEADASEDLGDGVRLNRGPWTSAEDALLVEYIQKHGEGNWKAVEEHSGLARLAKSCRLRWLNQLRPDLKKGPFSKEEEDRVVELHAKFGNKWSQMASELPGRTDNEIKNFWNVRIKKREKTGLPLYPPGVCPSPRVLNPENPTMTIVNPENQAEYSVIPEVHFKNIDVSQILQNATIPPDSVMPQFLLQQFGDSIPAFQYPEHLLPQTDTFYHNLDNIPLHSQYGDYTDEDFVEPLRPYIDPCDRYIDTSQQVIVNNPFGSHDFSSGNYSSSEATSVPTKLDLPSLQYLATHYEKWGSPMAPLSSLSVDNWVPLSQTDQFEIDPSRPRNNGFLEEIVYESQRLNRQSEQVNSAMPLAENSTLKSSQEDSDKHRYPQSSLAHSSASTLREHAPAIISSVDEMQSIEATTRVNEDPSYNAKKKGKSKIDPNRPESPDAMVKALGGESSEDDD